MPRAEPLASLGGASTLARRRALAEVAAGAGTPAYVYDLDGMAAEARALDAAFDGAPHLVAYAVKANTRGRRRAHARGARGAAPTSSAGPSSRVALGVRHRARAHRLQRRRQDATTRSTAPSRCGARGHRRDPDRERRGDRARRRRGRAPRGGSARVGVRVNPGVDLTERDRTRTSRRATTRRSSASRSTTRRDAVARSSSASPHLELVGLASHVGLAVHDASTPYLASARVALRRSSTALRARGRPAARVRRHRRRLRHRLRRRAAAAPGGLRARGARRAARRAASTTSRSTSSRGARSSRRTACCSRASSRRRSRRPRRWLMIDAGMNDLDAPGALPGAPPHRPARPRRRRRRVASRGASSVPSARAPTTSASTCCRASRPSAVAILDAGAYGYTMASRVQRPPAPGRGVPARRAHRRSTSARASRVGPGRRSLRAGRKARPERSGRGLSRRPRAATPGAGACGELDARPASRVPVRADRAPPCARSRARPPPRPRRMRRRTGRVPRAADDRRQRLRVSAAVRRRRTQLDSGHRRADASAVFTAFRHAGTRRNRDRARLAVGGRE